MLAYPQVAKTVKGCGVVELGGFNFPVLVLSQRMATTFLS